MGQVEIEADVKGVGTVGEVDDALVYLKHEHLTTMTAADEARLLRKIDWMIMPLMWLCYFLQYLDKTLSMHAPFFGATHLPCGPYTL